MGPANLGRTPQGGSRLKRVMRSPERVTTKCPVKTRSPDSGWTGFLIVRPFPSPLGGFTGGVLPKQVAGAGQFLSLPSSPPKKHNSAPKMDSWEAKMTKAPERVLDRVVLHLGDGVRRVVDPADVYYLEAQDEDTRVRLRSARPLVDMRPIAGAPAPLRTPRVPPDPSRVRRQPQTASVRSAGGTTVATGRSNSSLQSTGCCQ